MTIVLSRRISIVPAAATRELVLLYFLLFAALFRLMARTLHEKPFNEIVRRDITTIYVRKKQRAEGEAREPPPD